MRILSSAIFAIVTSLAFFHCGGDTTGTPDAADDSGDQDAAPDDDGANGAPSDTYPAFKVDAPQVVYSGGSVLTAPNVIPIYFQNDDTTFTAKITAMLDKLPTSTYWAPTTKEYGVGAITVAAPIQLTEDAPATIDDTAIRTWIAAKLTDGTFPPNDANTLFAIFYPLTTTVTSQNQTSCTSFGGYHDAYPQTTKLDVAYAVVPRCASFNGLTGIDSTTAATSHEIIEAATDPHPEQDAAYQTVDSNHIIWYFILGGGEVGDMCVASQEAYYNATDIGAIVQRTWSNAFARQGHDPCVPSTGQPYFNSMPALTDSITINGLGTTKGVTIPVGGSLTIDVDLFSDAKTSGPWTVTALDTAQFQQQPKELDFTWDRTSGVNGEILHLTINVIAKSQYGVEAFILESKLGTQTNLWAGIVGN